jgi:hypothetical protein
MDYKRTGLSSGLFSAHQIAKGCSVTAAIQAVKARSRGGNDASETAFSP